MWRGLLVIVCNMCDIMLLSLMAARGSKVGTYVHFRGRTTMRKPANAPGTRTFDLLDGGL